MIGLVVLALICVTVLLYWYRRHQKLHCAHLYELSAAVAALSDFIADRVPGELPEDVSSFSTAWKAQDAEAVEDAPPHERL